MDANQTSKMFGVNSEVAKSLRTPLSAVIGKATIVVPSQAAGYTYAEVPACAVKLVDHANHIGINWKSSVP